MNVTKFAVQNAREQFAVPGKRADQVVVGDKFWHGGTVRTVQEVRTNPYYGWIGFIYGPSSFDWCGWYNPHDSIPMDDGQR